MTSRARGDAVARAAVARETLVPERATRARALEDAREDREAWEALEAKLSRLREDGDGGGFDALVDVGGEIRCLLYTSPSPRDATLSRMPSSA